MHVVLPVTRPGDTGWRRMMVLLIAASRV